MAQVEACMVNQLIMSCVDDFFKKFNRLKIYLTIIVYFFVTTTLAQIVYDMNSGYFLLSVKNYNGHNQNLIVDFKIKNNC